MKKQRVYCILFLFSLVIGLNLLQPAQALAATSGTCDGNSWRLSDNGTLTITGENDLYGHDDEYGEDYGQDIPWYQYRENIKKIVIGGSIRSIGQYMFVDCTNVTEVSLSDKLEAIGKGAFKNCTSLTSITLPESVGYLAEEVFRDCTALKSLYIGNPSLNITNWLPFANKIVTEETADWKYGPFAGCNALTTISIPDDCYAFLKVTNNMFDRDEHPVPFKKLEFRGSIEHWKSLMGNKNLFPSPVFFFADSVVCSDGALEETVSVCYGGNPTIKTNRTASYYINMDGNGKLTSAGWYNAYYPYITEVDISGYPKSVAKNSFVDFYNLKKVTFQMGEEHWDAVTIEEGNENLIQAEKIFCQHNGSLWTNGRDATCTKEGYRVKACSLCSHELMDTYKVVPALGHQYNGVEVEANCCSGVGKKYTCVRCSDHYYEELSPAKNKNNHLNVSDVHVDPTCTEVGYDGKACTDCGKVLTKEKTYPKVAHSFYQCGEYEDGTPRKQCKFCGKGEYVVNLKDCKWIYDSSYCMNVFTFAATPGTVDIALKNEKNEYPVETIQAGATSYYTSANPGYTYTLKLTRTIKYYLNGTMKTEKASMEQTKCIPNCVGSFTVKNISGGQQLSWKSSVPKTYCPYPPYTLSCNGKNKITGNNISTTNWTNKSDMVNGKKYTYKLFAVYKFVKTPLYASYQSEIKPLEATCYYLTRPSLTSCKNISGSKIKLTWKRNSAATGYQLKYVTGSTTKTLSISGNKTVTKTLTKLKKGKTYKCYVRAYKTVSGKKYYSAWSSYKSVKVI